MEQIKSFYALKPCWLSRDKFYKIYISDSALYGALLARQVYDESSATYQLIYPAQFLAPLARLWTNRIIRKRQERERLYDEMTLCSQEFLNESHHNFKILKNEILDTHIDEKQTTHWTGACCISGILHIRIINMREIKFILVGNQDIESILAAIK